jgi:hypothetical protein
LWSSSISTRDAEAVCESGGFIAEEVNGAGHKGSEQIPQDNIMGSLSILDVTDAKPSGLETIFFNCQSIRIFGVGASRVYVFSHTFLYNIH